MKEGRWVIKSALQPAFEMALGVQWVGIARDIDVGMRRGVHNGLTKPLGMRSGGKIKKKIIYIYIESIHRGPDMRHPRRIIRSFYAGADNDHY